MSKASILTDIDNKILTGGRQTTAANTRIILKEMTNEAYNENDGFIIIKSSNGHRWRFTVGDDGYLIQPGEDLGI